MIAKLHALSKQENVCRPPFADIPRCCNIRYCVQIAVEAHQAVEKFSRDLSAGYIYNQRGVKSGRIVTQSAVEKPRESVIRRTGRKCRENKAKQAANA